MIFTFKREQSITNNIQYHLISILRNFLIMNAIRIQQFFDEKRENIKTFVIRNFFFFFFLMLLNDSSYVMHISYFIFHTSNVHGITITRDHEVLCKSIDIYHGKWSSINPAPLTFRLVSLENSEERASDDVDKILYLDDVTPNTTPVVVTLSCNLLIFC